MLPSKQEIIDAIIDSKNFMENSLSGCQLIMNGMFPLYYQGGFGMVFKANVNGEEKAIKVWTVKIDEIKERLHKVSTFLNTLPLPYFVSYDFFEGGLKVPADLSVDDTATDQLLDILVMDWADGVLLKECLHNKIKICTHIEFQQFCTKLASNLKQCFYDLHKKHISHGDLQHGNILIKEVNGEPQIILIDYDSIYVPPLIGCFQTTSGLGAFQHPGRISAGTTTKCTEKDDYFSEKILYLTLLLLANDPDLWDDVNVNVEENDWGILFKQEDFDNFENSYIYSYVKSNSRFSSEITNLLDEIANDLKKNFYEVGAMAGTLDSIYKQKTSSPIDVDLGDIAILKDGDRNIYVAPAKKIDIPEVDKSKYQRKNP